MPHYLRFYLTFLMPAAVAFAIYHGGWMVWIAPIWSFVILPIMDYLAGNNTRNVAENEEDRYNNNTGYNLLVLCWPFIQIPILIYALYTVATVDFTAIEYIGLAVSVGIVTGSLGITWAHELCHRTGFIEKLFAEILLTSVSYAHFSIEHVYGHHKNVATTKDPATSRYGEGFYRFLPRTVIGSFLSAWDIEKAQLKKKGRPFLHYNNRMLRYVLVQVLVFAAVYMLLGGLATLFFALQAVIAFTLLELINYIEHYGLERKQLPDGRYEKVQPWHSWNSSSLMSNLALINLARHSDHHFKASRKYQILRHFEEAPQLPLGYGGMLVIATVPPLWFYIMNPKVEDWRDQNRDAEETIAVGSV